MRDEFRSRPLLWDTRQEATPRKNNGDDFKQDDEKMSSFAGPSTYNPGSTSRRGIGLIRYLTRTCMDNLDANTAAVAA